MKGVCFSIARASFLSGGRTPRGSIGFDKGVSKIIIGWMGEGCAPSPLIPIPMLPRYEKSWS